MPEVANMNVSIYLLQSDCTVEAQLIEDLEYLHKAHGS